MAETNWMTCQHDEILGPDWPLPVDDIMEAMELLEEPVWRGEIPDRYGFVDPELWDDTVVMGYFAVEKPIPIVTYDDEKHREEHHEESFEHVWFALFLDEGRLLTQRRRFIHRALRMPNVLKQLRESIMTVLVRVGHPVRAILPIERQVTKEEFLAQFALGNIRELIVDTLEGALVPKSVTLYNPNVDRDAILREAITDDNQRLAEIRGRAAEGEDLSKTRFFRAEVQAGEPKRLVRETEHEVITLERTVTDRIQFPVHEVETRVTPTDAEKENIVATVRETRPTIRRKKAPEGQFSLFEDSNDRDDR